MTRVTPLPSELAKLTRSLGRTVAAPKPNRLLNSTSRSAAIYARKQLENSSRASEVSSTIATSLSCAPYHCLIPSHPVSLFGVRLNLRLSDQPHATTTVVRTMTTTHRPTAQPTPNPARTIPLMSSFHTTPASSAQADMSTIDYAFLPSFESLYPSAGSDPFRQVRVPLLPDNSVADSPLHAPEAVDAPLVQPQIVIMAADPTRVSAVSMLSEVEGMSPDGVELSFAHDNWGRRPAEEQQYAGGMLRTLWDGLVDDVLGDKQKMKPAI